MKRFVLLAAAALLLGNIGCSHGILHRDGRQTLRQGHAARQACCPAGGEGILGRALLGHRRAGPPSAAQAAPGHQYPSAARAAPGHHYPADGYYPPSMASQPGPPGGTVAYPYYTLRGPRDFLLDNPPSIGH